MKNHQINFQTFISNTLESKYLGRKDENRISFFQEWNGSVYNDVHFYEIIELKNYKWLLRHSIWEIGKDSFRLLNTIENLKWIGKEIHPSFKVIEVHLPENEKEILHRMLSNLKLEPRRNFQMLFFNLLKLKTGQLETAFYWNKDDQLNDPIFNLIDRIKNNSKK